MSGSETFKVSHQIRCSHRRGNKGGVLSSQSLKRSQSVASCIQLNPHEVDLSLGLPLLANLTVFPDLAE